MDVEIRVGNLIYRLVGESEEFPEELFTILHDYWEFELVNFGCEGDCWVAVVKDRIL